MEIEAEQAAEVPAYDASSAIFLAAPPSAAAASSSPFECLPESLAAAPSPPSLAAVEAHPEAIVAPSAAGAAAADDAHPSEDAAPVVSDTETIPDDPPPEAAAAPAQFSAPPSASPVPEPAPARDAPAAPAAPVAPPAPAAAAPAAPSSSLWRLAAELAPADYSSGGSFTSLVQVSASTVPTAEGLRCAACSHWILLSVGAHWDAAGSPLCASCASCAGILHPRNRRRGAVTADAAGGGAAAVDDDGVAAAAAAEEEAASADEALAEVEAQAAATADLASATAHLQRLVHAGGELAAALASQMEAEGLELADVGGRAVLAAFDEAEAMLCERAEGEPGDSSPGGSAGDSSGDSAGDSADSDSLGSSPAPLRVFDALVRRWQAQVPLGLLRALQDVAAPPPLLDGTHTGGGVGVSGPLVSPQLATDEIRRLRVRYARCFATQGLRIAAAQP